MATKYPDVHVKLVGRDGNAFAIIGAVHSALRKHVSKEAADAYQREAMLSTSYDALLRHATQTVNVS